MALGRALMQVGRQFSTTVARRSGWQQQGVPGSNLPFPIDKPYKVTLAFIFFFGTGLGTPFFLVRHQLLKD